MPAQSGAACFSERMLVILMTMAKEEDVCAQDLREYCTRSRDFDCGSLVRLLPDRANDRM